MTDEATNPQDEANAIEKNVDRERVNSSVQSVGLTAAPEQVRFSRQDNIEADAEAEHDDDKKSLDVIDTAETKRQQLREEWEEQRRMELMEKLYGSYTVGADSKNWYTKDRNDLAFSVNKNAIKTERNDDATVQDMLTLAEAKGWDSIKIKGKPDFRRAVWMEASLRGIETAGYRPKQADIEELEARKHLRSNNTIEAANPEQTKEKTQQVNADKEQQKAPKATQAEMLHGTLLEHGVANKDFKAKGESSYYVRIDTPLGRKIAWGADLQRAMKASEAKRGDKINLDNVDYRNIEVKEDKVVKDRLHGHVIKTAADQFLNKHVVDQTKRQKYSKAMQAAINAREQNNTLPKVHVYDKTAPTQTKEVAVPVVERNSERTR